jgi:DNA-binding NarL/FixJ family response regulator
MSTGPADATARPGARLPRLRVVLADDHEAVANRLRTLLDVDCDVVAVVADGESLIQAVNALAPDVIVSDVSMPGVNGLAAARTILQQHPDARIVLLTVHDEKWMVRTALRLGVLGYVLKEDAGEELLVAVQAAKDGRPHRSARLGEDLL